MNILFVLEHYHPYLGGAEKLFKQVAESMAEKGHQVTVVTTQFDTKLPKIEKINRVEVHRIQCYNRFLFTVLSLPKLFVLAKKADFIQTTTYNAALPAWIIGKIYRKKIFLTFHELWGSLWFKLPYLSTIQRYLFYSYEQIISKLPFYHYIAVSDSTKNDLIAAGISENKITRIYNGVDYQKLSNYTSQKNEFFTAIYYGRLGVSKGLDLLLPAWDQFAKENPTCKLQLVIPRSPEGMYQKINSLIESCQSKNTIKVFHELEERSLFQMVSNAHAVVIPSYKEGFCFVAAEAMALGTPIISSGKGALKEVVNGKYLELEEHSIDELLKALKHAYSNKWEESPKRMFPFDDAKKLYSNLYETTIK